jgi:hypothetical protein
VVVRIKSVETFSDAIRNGNRGLPACSIVPQPTTPPHVPSRNHNNHTSLAVGNTGIFDHLKLFFNKRKGAKIKRIENKLSRMKKATN